MFGICFSDAMDQLPLRIVPRLQYAAKNFVLHRGAADVARTVEHALSGPGFQPIFVTGAKRSGLTHFSIWLVESLLQQGRLPLIIEGESLLAWAAQRIAGLPFEARDVVIIDDIEAAFLDRSHDARGVFVSLNEMLRLAGAGLVFLSHEKPGNIPADDHVLSRLRSAAHLELGAPGEDELPAIIRMLAEQRGVSLTGRKTSYLSRRIGRSIAEIERYFERAITLAEASGKRFDLPVLADAVSRPKASPSH